MNAVPTPSKPVFAFAEECHRGLVREENQDSVWHVRIALGELLIVADGIGGYKGGAVASRMVVEGFYRYLSALPKDYPPQRAIEEASARTNAAIVAAASAPNSPYSRMGSTVVLALLQQDAAGTHAWIGHVGDSRAYRVRDGRLIRLTNDHSAVQALLNRNLITPEEALHHPDASVLTRSMGHKEEVEIDIDPVDLEEGETLLLCSDGLWGYVAEQEIERVAADPGLPLERTARGLLELALAAGGHDNIGIELVRLSRPLAVIPRSIKPPRRYRFMEVLAVCLLAFAALGTLAYFAAQSPKLQSLLHWSRHESSRLASPLAFAVLAGPDVDLGDLADKPGWHLIEPDPDRRASCLSLVAHTPKPTIYTNEQNLARRFRKDYPSLFPSGVEPEIGKLAGIETECGRGRFALIVILPGNQAVAPPESSVPPPAKPPAPAPANPQTAKSPSAHPAPVRSLH
ncbi:MAG: protein phosphatase 2C domain-containing protein [Terracidiphilus sp.]|jgi:protein phosphatase